MLLIPEEIIIRSLQGTATEEESRLLHEWLHANKQHVAVYAQMEEIWSSRHTLDKEAIGQGWDRLYKDIQELPGKKAFRLSSKTSTIPLWMRYAAAVVAGALITSAVWFGIRSERLDQPELWAQNRVYNHTGIQAVLLPDSSEVFIHENSNITYPEIFTAGQRHIVLEGSAYFDVRKDVKKPFVVSIGKVDIEVTGTEFFIDSSPRHSMSVTLISGGVQVNCENETGRISSAKLIPGQKANIDRAEGKIQVETVDVAYHVAWKDGTYRFADESLETIARMVGKRYGLDIRIASSLKAKHFTGRVTPTDDIFDILATIHKSYPIQYKITDKTVDITE